MDNAANLEWQKDMGADEAISETPINRLEAKKATVEEKPTSDVIEKPAAKPKAVKKAIIAEAAGKARKLADKCTTLDELRGAVCNFDGLAIQKTATNTVFSDGNPKAKIMLIGEAPGANEDLEGIPFCGDSGKLMDEMLKWAGFSRKENIYISNTLFWRPPGNRRPTPEEIETCKPFLEKHIALINPEILVMIGSTSAMALLNTKTGITKLRGQYFDYTNDYMDKTIASTALFHPAFLLRQPSQKRFFWRDLLNMKQFLKNGGKL